MVKSNNMRKKKIQDVRKDEKFKVSGSNTIYDSATIAGNEYEDPNPGYIISANRSGYIWVPDDTEVELVTPDTSDLQKIRIVVSNNVGKSEDVVLPTISSDSTPVGMMWQDDKWVPVPDNESNPFSDKYENPTYETLEEVITDIGKVYTPDTDKASEELDRIYLKLKATVANGCYIQCNPTE